MLHTNLDTTHRHKRADSTDIRWYQTSAACYFRPSHDAFLSFRRCRLVEISRGCTQHQTCFTATTTPAPVTCSASEWDKTMTGSFEDGMGSAGGRLKIPQTEYTPGTEAQALQNWWLRFDKDRQCRRQSLLVWLKNDENRVHGYRKREQGQRDADFCSDGWHERGQG